MYRHGTFPMIFVYSALSWSILYHSTPHRSWQVNDVLVPAWILPGNRPPGKRAPKTTTTPLSDLFMEKNGEKCSTVEHLDRCSFLSMGKKRLETITSHNCQFIISTVFLFFATINQSGMMARIKSWGKFKWKKNSKCVFHRELSGTCCSKWFQA